MSPIDFEKFELLTEAEQMAITSKWTDEDWGEYYMKRGGVSIDDFFQELEEEAIKMAMEKYSLLSDTYTENEDDKTTEQTMNE